MNIVICYALRKLVKYFLIKSFKKIFTVYIYLYKCKNLFYSTSKIININILLILFFSAFDSFLINKQCSKILPKIY